MPLRDVIAKHRIKVKFVIVGIWNTIFGYLVFVGLDFLFASLFSKRYIAYMTAAVLANILAITNAYIFHKYLTFRSEVKGRGIISEFLRFSSTYAATTIMGLILLPFSVEVFCLEPKIAGAMLIPITSIISYFGHSLFSFKK